MIVNNTFSVTLRDKMGDESLYVFNLRHCMYLSRNSPMCLRFVFGTRNLVIHFNSLDAVNRYLPQFIDYLEGNQACVEINDEDYETCEIEIKE